MKVKLKQDYDWIGNDEEYFKDEILEVTEIEYFPNNYARYFKLKNGYETMDWIPKEICEIIQ